jgi:hypothetical protein
MEQQRRSLLVGERLDATKYPPKKKQALLSMTWWSIQTWGVVTQVKRCLARRPTGFSPLASRPSVEVKTKGATAVSVRPRRWFSARPTSIPPNLETVESTGKIHGIEIDT